MSDTTLNQFISRGTNAQRVAFTPSPATPATGNNPSYIFYETDTGNTYMWDGSAWQKINTGSGGTSGPIPAGLGGWEQMDHEEAVVPIIGQFSTGLAGVVPPSGGGTSNFLRADGTWAAPPGGGMTLIQEQVPSGTGTVTFSSISGTYRYLQIVFLARSDTAATATGLSMQFNSDTGSNYDVEEIQAESTVLNGFEAIGGTSANIGSVSAASATSGLCGSGEIKIPYYADTTFQKTFSSVCAYKTANSTTNVFTQLRTGAWRSTAAITSITLSLAAGNYVSGSKLALYGIS